MRSFTDSLIVRAVLVLTIIMLGSLIIVFGCSSKKPAALVPHDAMSDDADASAPVAPNFDSVKYSDSPLCENYARKPQELCKISDPRLREISGIAVDSNGIIWVHNDSGDGPIIYALNQKCKNLGEVVLAGAQAIDWEDMAIGRCGDTDCFYAGDIGDNHRSRSDYVIYKTKVPTVDPDKPFGKMKLTNVDNLVFTYPKGKQNAEALAVHPDGTIYLFTKEKSGKSELYALADPVAGQKTVLVHVGSVPTKLGPWTSITGADIHPTGRRLLLRTYITVLEWRQDEEGDFRKILFLPTIRVPNMDEQQGEAVAFHPKTGEYLHVSEGVNPTIYIIRCKDE